MQSTQLPVGPSEVEQINDAISMMLRGGCFVTLVPNHGTRPELVWVVGGFTGKLVPSMEIYDTFVLSSQQLARVAAHEMAHGLGIPNDLLQGAAVFAPVYRGDSGREYGRSLVADLAGRPLRS